MEATGISLNVNLNMQVGLKPELKDLKEIDYSECESMERIEQMSEDEFKASIFESFTTMLSDRQSVVELKEGGHHIPVT
jgi:hypothetical protein